MAAFLCSTSLCGDITVSDSFLVINIKGKCCWRRGRLVNGGLKFHALKVGSVFHRKKHWRKTMRCSVVSMKCSDFSVSMISKTLKSSNSSSGEVTKVLMSLANSDSAFSYFKSMAENSNLVHTTETCNYMLEALRVDGKIEDMAYVFDLMQKRIIKRDTNTFSSIFKCLSVKGGLRLGFAMEVYRRMILEGFRPSLQTFSSLMVGLGKRRDIEAVMALLNDVILTTDDRTDDLSSITDDPVEVHDDLTINQAKDPTLVLRPQTERPRGRPRRRPGKRP